MRISDLSSDVCSSDLAEAVGREHLARDALDGGEHLGIGDPRAAQFHDEADLARCCHYSNTFSMRFMVSRWVRSRCSGVTEMPPSAVTARRSEEHTSELQSLMRISYAVFCLKKNTKQREC